MSDFFRTLIREFHKHRRAALLKYSMSAIGGLIIYTEKIFAFKWKQKIEGRNSMVQSLVEFPVFILTDAP